jgi:CRP/FNR family transcriptional regulator, cyclic AMP receptor protein
MDTLEPLLREHGFFSGLDPAHIELLVGCSTNVRFAPGEFLLRDGDPAERFFMIRRGHVAIEVPAPAGGSITVQTVGEDEVVGFSWLFEPYRWEFDARALEPTTAIALDGVCLRGKCDEDPRLGYDRMKRFARVMVSRLQATRLQLLDVYGHAGAR